MATYLYLLPPSLKPCEPIDSLDIRYLNQSHALIIKALSKHLAVEIYNETWFNKPPRKSQSFFYYNHSTLAFPDPQLTPFTSLSDLHAETNTIQPPPLIEKSGLDIISLHSPLVYSKLLSTSDGLFFIRYTPEDIFKQRWFLVQVNHVETTILNMYPATTCDYHVTLLARQPDDKHLCDDKTRLWPKWHKYQLDGNNVPVYETRMLFSPKHKPNLKTFML